MLRSVVIYNRRAFSPGTPVFPSPQKPTFPNSNSTRYQVDEEPLSYLFIYLFIYPQNDNSVGASNLMAGNRKLARKVTVLLKAISLVP